jgi:hypothetical protein
MRKPRVFISHSTRDDPDTRPLLDDLRTALQDDFAVLIDKDDLKAGDPWRQTLNTWIGGCDVAIVLLTPKALLSEYVAYEVTILTYREKSLPAQKCTLIPVFLGSVNDKAVREARGFGAAQIAEWQAIVGNPGPELVEQIRQKLAGLRILPSPIEEQELYLENVFRDLVPRGKIEDALDKLNVELDGWKVEPARSLALALISRGLNAATIDVILSIRAYIRDRERLETMFEIMATSWIDLRSSRRLETIAMGGRDQRVVAVNAASDFIARKYVWRAGNRPPTDSWNMAAVTGIFSEVAIDPLQMEIRRSLQQVFRLGADEDLQDQLDWYDEKRQPVFVALPAAGMTTTILGQLRASFPTVTFFLLAGGDKPLLSAMEAQNIELLEPRLTPDFDEPAFIRNYKRERLGAVETYLRQHGL